MVEVVAVRNVSQRLYRAHFVPCVSDWSRAVLRACRDALRPTGLAGRICPEMRSATRPVPRNSVPAIFFPAAAPLLAQQQDRRTPSFACAAA